MIDLTCWRQLTSMRWFGRSQEKLFDCVQRKRKVNHSFEICLIFFSFWISMGVPKWKQRPEFLVFAEPLRKLIWIQFPYFHRHVVVTIDIFVTTSANYLNNSNILPFNHAAEQISAIMEIGTNRSHLSIDRISGRHWIQSLINWILAVKLARKNGAHVDYWRLCIDSHWFIQKIESHWFVAQVEEEEGGRAD